ncbi:MAG: hypothetical protein AAGA18_15415 [Verrucomicrobiota bacterium]
MNFWNKFGLQLGVSIIVHVIIFIILGGVILYEVPISKESIKSAGVFAEDHPIEKEVKDEALLLEEPILEQADELETAVGLDEVLTVAEAPPLDSFQDVISSSVSDQLNVAIPSVAYLADQSLVSSASDGSGGSAILGKIGQKATSLSSTVSFFGVKDFANKIVIAFDVSSSVLTKAKAVGVTTERMKDEAIKVLRGLSRDTEFGLLQFVRNYKVFEDRLVLASGRNVKEAKEWIEDEFISSGSMPAGGKDVIRKDPNGIESVLKQTFSWDPDVIYLISDGSFYRGVGMQKVPYSEINQLITELQRGRNHLVKIHFIGFEMKDNERRELTRIISRTGGSLIQMEAM